MEKKHTLKTSGITGVVSNKQNSFVIAEDQCLIKYDLRTDEPLKRLTAKEIIGLELDEKEEILYGFNAESIYLVELKSFDIIDIVTIRLPEEYDEWELKRCYHLEGHLFLLIILVLGDDGDRYAFLYDSDSAYMDLVYREDTDHSMWFDKCGGLRIIKNDEYRPKSDKNTISCERKQFYSDVFSVEIAISIFRADQMMVRKPGVLYYVDPNERFSLVMEDTHFKMQYVFVDNHSNEIIKRIPAPNRYCPMEATLIPECECLALEHTKKIVIFSIKELAFEVQAAVRIDLTFSPPLYFQDTEQLLILDLEEGTWIDV